MSDLNSSGFFSNSSRLQISESRYISLLRKAEREKKEKESCVMNKDKWDYFADYSKNKLIESCVALSHTLKDEGVSIIGIDVEKDKSFEPVFIVYLSNEYRNDEEYLSMLPQTWSGRLSVQYRIYS